MGQYIADPAAFRAHLGMGVGDRVERIAKAICRAQKQQLAGVECDCHLAYAGCTALRWHGHDAHVAMQEVVAILSERE